MAERPPLRPYVDRMKRALASSLGVAPESVNLKATTGDGIGFVGREEGIAVLAIATLEDSKRRREALQHLIRRD